MHYYYCVNFDSPKYYLHNIEWSVAPHLAALSLLRTKSKNVTLKALSNTNGILAT